MLGLLGLNLMAQSRPRQGYRAATESDHPSNGAPKQTRYTKYNEYGGQPNDPCLRTDRKRAWDVSGEDNGDSDDGHDSNDHDAILFSSRRYEQRGDRPIDQT